MPAPQRPGRVARRIDAALAEAKERAEPSAGQLERYCSAALKRTTVERLDNGAYYASIPGFRGVWTDGATEADAKRELAEVLREWLSLKIADRDGDIPAVDGIDLNKFFLDGNMVAEDRGPTAPELLAEREAQIAALRECLGEFVARTAHWSMVDHPWANALLTSTADAAARCVERIRRDAEERFARTIIDRTAGEGEIAKRIEADLERARQEGAEEMRELIAQLHDALGKAGAALFLSRLSMPSGWREAIEKAWDDSAP